MSKRMVWAGTAGMIVCGIAAAGLLVIGELVFAGTALVLFSFSMYLRETNN